MMEPIRILILSISLFTIATIIVNWDDIAEAHRKLEQAAIKHPQGLFLYFLACMSVVIVVSLVWSLV